MSHFCDVYQCTCTARVCGEGSCGRSLDTWRRAEEQRGVLLDREGKVLGPQPQQTQAQLPAVVNDSKPIPGIRFPQPSPILANPEPPRAPKVDRGLMLLLGVGGVAATFLLVATGALAFYVYSESISLDQQRRQLALEQAQPIAPPPAVLPSAPAEPLVVAKAEPASVVIPQDLALRPLAVEALPDRVDAAPLDNSPAAVMKRKGNELVAAGDFSGARNFYRSAVEANPYYFEGYNNLGNTYTDTGAHGVAEPVYQRGLSLAPESDTLRFNLGNSYFRAGRYNEAIPHLERLIYYKPEDKEARLILGCCYYHLQRFNDAAQQFSVVLKEQSNHPEANFNMGLTLRALGQADLASAYLREAQRVREEAQQ